MLVSQLSEYAFWFNHDSVISLKRPANMIDIPYIVILNDISCFLAGFGSYLAADKIAQMPIIFVAYVGVVLSLFISRIVLFVLHDIEKAMYLRALTFFVQLGCIVIFLQLNLVSGLCAIAMASYLAYSAYILREMVRLNRAVRVKRQ
ncbi:hypothetical protein ACOME3_006940 [Neoechinorhynchus agilis]